jgi:hypothetical protein
MTKPSFIMVQNRANNRVTRVIRLPRAIPKGELSVFHRGAKKTI